MTNEHRRSNNFFGRDKKNEGLITMHGVIGTGNKKFLDLRMYLKVPKKKEFYSEIKRRKDDRQRVHSVYY